MACFWTKLQIPGSFFSQGKECPKLLENCAEKLVDKVCSIDLRSFFSWRRSNEDKSEASFRSGNLCRKKLPDRPQPCNPECSSKCLQISGCADKKLAMRKLSNCRDTENSKNEPKSYWEILFGWKPEVEKKPDAGKTCRLDYCEKRISRERDPRLCDPRYEATAGDVLIFTEHRKPEVCGKSAQEPQPKPPPSYKLPKAVITQKITDQAEKTPHNCAAAMHFDPSCESPKCSGPKPSILPFEELRPPDKQRKMFSCRAGLRPPDVPQSFRTTVVNSRDSTSRIANYFAETKANENDDSAEFSIHSVRGNSRVEQLKKLTRAKEGGKCSELFSSNNTSSDDSKCPTTCSQISCK